MSNDARGNYAAGTGEIIADLPKVIANYPILIWGYDPCDSNSICRLGLGPSDQKVTGVRKGYPQYKKFPKRFLFSEDEDWASLDFERLGTFQMSPDEFVDLVNRAGVDSALLPRAYSPKSPNKLKIKTPYEWEEEDLLSLQANNVDLFNTDFSNKLINLFSQCKDKLQDLLIQRGMALWSHQPDTSFSFHPTTGEIEICHGERFLAQSTPAIENSDPSPINWDGLHLSGLQIKSAVLMDSSMVGVQLKGANMKSSNLKGSILREANLGLLDMEIQTDLSEANLSEADLRKTNFSVAILMDATFSKSNMTEANLSGADLTRANLTECNLTDAIIEIGEREDPAILDKANFTGANLTRVNCKKAIMYETVLSNAILHSADLSGVEGFANFSRSILRDAILQEASLADSDFSNADLQRANLNNSNLSGAIFENAILDHATLKGANMKYADLSGASMRGVDLSTSNLTDAIYNTSTVWPEGFSPQDARATLLTDE